MSRAFLAVAVAGSISFGIVVPAAASGHKAAVHLTARAHDRTVLSGQPVVISGVVHPAAVGPIVLERLVNQTWTVLARAKTTRAGVYSFHVHTAGHSAAWLLQVVRPASKSTSQAVSPTLRVQVATRAYAVQASLEYPIVYIGTPSHLLGTVLPAPPAGVQLQRLEGRTWRTVATVPVGSNGGFSGYVTLPIGDTQLRAVEAPSDTIAGGTGAAVTATVLRLPDDGQ